MRLRIYTRDPLGFIRTLRDLASTDVVYIDTPTNHRGTFVVDTKDDVDEMILRLGWNAQDALAD